MAEYKEKLEKSQSSGKMYNTVYFVLGIGVGVIGLSLYKKKKEEKYEEGV